MLISKLSEKGRTINNTDELVDYLREHGVAQSSSGATVTPSNALRQSTVFSCVRILSESLAQLPINLFQVTDKTRRIARENPLFSLIHDAPNGWMSAYEFWQMQSAQVELRGNAYGEKIRNGVGKTREIIPINPDLVNPVQDSNYKLRYEIKGQDVTGATTLPQEKILHIRNLSNDGISGLSTIALQRDAIGLAMQVEKHGAVLFKNGAQLSKVITHPKTLSDTAHEHLKESMRDEYTGAENAHKVMIAEEGMDIKTIGMTSEDAQFLETRRFQKQDIAGIFGVPLFMLNDTEKSTTWGSGLEQLSRAFVQFTLGPRFKRIEQAMARDLLTPKERKEYYFKYNANALLRGDISTRFELYVKGLTNGVYSANEVREMEELNPRDGGDEYMTPLNMATGEEEPVDEPESEPEQGENDEN